LLKIKTEIELLKPISKNLSLAPPHLWINLNALPAQEFNSYFFYFTAVAFAQNHQKSRLSISDGTIQWLLETLKDRLPICRRSWIKSIKIDLFGVTGGTISTTHEMSEKLDYEYIAWRDDGKTREFSAISTNSEKYKLLDQGHLLAFAYSEKPSNRLGMRPKIG